MGDGDAMSIGGNHLVHAMRRNIGMVAVVVNNNVYGLTGGQSSPTTPVGGISTTASIGSFERPMNLEALARTAGAPFFARATVNHTASLTKAVEKALEIDGFALVEVISNCHVIYGRMNGMPEASDMIAAMDQDTHRTNPTLEKRGALAHGLTASGLKTRNDLLAKEGVTEDDRQGRGVIWERTGSVDLSRRYRSKVAAIPADEDGGWM
jgi:2-oxoglutarate ferredoxin oxidoreductase subunit beta